MKCLTIFQIFLLTTCSIDKPAQDTHFDVVIVGGGASGSMAGIQAARLGSKTLIIEKTPWLGGMLTSAGVSAIDGNYRLHSGLWEAFRQRLYHHYGGEERVKTGWVSNVLFEPQVGARIIKTMADGESQLKIWFQSYITSIAYVKDHWEVKVNRGGVECMVKGQVVIDGTELGDVSKQVGIPYDIGMDSRKVSEEAIAPEQANDIIQDLTYVAILKDYGDSSHLIQKPENYDPSYFYCTCAGICDQDTISRKLWGCEQMMNYGKLPNDYYMINWPIYGNDFYVNAIELDEVDREEAYDKAKWFTKCYVYYLQQELGFASLGITDDVFPTKDGFPCYPYHRESRRIHGKVRFDINDLARPFEQEDALYRTGIAVGDYPVDHHHAAYPNHDQLPDLHFYPVPSYSLPLGTLIPENTEHFIVAEKSISVTNIVNGTTRLQPVCLLIGQAAGVLAHLSAKSKLTPGSVPVRDVQQILLDNGAYLMPYSDVSPDNLAFTSIQKIGATGILKGEGKNIGWENHTLFHPDSVLTLEALKDGFVDFEPDFNIDLRNNTISIGNAVTVIMDFARFSKFKTLPDSNFIGDIWQEYQFGTFKLNQTITREQFAVLLDKMIDPFQLKQVDHFGNFIE